VFVVAITGKKRHGKDECANALSSLGFKQYVFAAKLKEMANSITLALQTNNECYKATDRMSMAVSIIQHVYEIVGTIQYKGSESVPEIAMNIADYIYASNAFVTIDNRLFPVMEGNKPRIMLQLLGDITRRIFGQDVWLQYTIDRIAEDRQDLIVISDCRFPYERKLLADKFGAFILKVYRPGMSDDDGHPSETLVDSIEGIDAMVINDGTIEDLHRAVKKVLFKTLSPAIMTYDV